VVWEMRGGMKRNAHGDEGMRLLGRRPVKRLYLGRRGWWVAGAEGLGCGQNRPSGPTGSNILVVFCFSGQLSRFGVPGTGPRSPFGYSPEHNPSEVVVIGCDASLPECFDPKL